MRDGGGLTLVKKNLNFGRLSLGETELRPTAQPVPPTIVYMSLLPILVALAPCAHAFASRALTAAVDGVCRNGLRLRPTLGCAVVQ